MSVGNHDSLYFALVFYPSLPGMNKIAQYFMSKHVEAC